MWKLIPQQQQRGIQINPRKPGEAPADAVKGREAQDHDQADLDLSGGRAKPGSIYPASSIERGGDNVPRAPETQSEDQDNLPLPEGK